ncbi:MAG TPA: septum formation initiator family protein [Verrucomicrobiae bacterium]|nr:septum formation initiator family protein [Verrucomicrobiae bacterium]
MAENAEINLGIWAALTRLVKWLLGIAALMAIFVWYKPLFDENQRLRSAVLKLDTQIAREEESGRQLRASIEAVSRDPKTVERLAREKFSYAKPGETVIRFDASGAAARAVR